MVTHINCSWALLYIEGEKSTAFFCSLFLWVKNLYSLTEVVMLRDLSKAK